MSARVVKVAPDEYRIMVPCGLPELHRFAEPDDCDGLVTVQYLPRFPQYAVLDEVCPACGSTIQGEYEARIEDAAKAGMAARNDPPQRTTQQMGAYVTDAYSAARGEKYGR